MRGLSGKTVLITGATGLIGTAAVLRFLEEGSRVIITSRSQAKAEEWVRSAPLPEGHSSSEKIIAMELDLSSEDSIRSAVEKMAAEGSIPDILIANASLREGLGTPLNDIKLEQFTNLAQVDVGGHFVLTRELLERKPDLNVVFLSSIYGLNAVDHRIYAEGMLPTPVQYAAVKAALLGLSRYLASLWGSTGFRANTVVSGGVRAEGRQNPEFVKNYSYKTMMGRLAEPEEIAAAIAFLASDDSSYITGAVLEVDGGFGAW